MPWTPGLGWTLRYMKKTSLNQYTGVTIDIIHHLSSLKCCLTALYFTLIEYVLISCRGRIRELLHRGGRSTTTPTRRLLVLSNFLFFHILYKTILLQWRHRASLNVNEKCLSITVSPSNVLLMRYI